MHIKIVITLLLCLKTVISDNKKPKIEVITPKTSKNFILDSIDI